MTIASWPLNWISVYSTTFIEHIEWLIAVCSPREFSVVAAFNVARLTKQNNKAAKPTQRTYTSLSLVVVGCFFLRGFYTIFTHNDTDMYIATIMIIAPMTATAENDGDKFRFRVRLSLLFLLLLSLLPWQYYNIQTPHTHTKYTQFAEQQHKNMQDIKSHWFDDSHRIIVINFSFTFTITFSMHHNISHLSELNVATTTKTQQKMIIIVKWTANGFEQIRDAIFANRYTHTLRKQIANNTVKIVC